MGMREDWNKRAEENAFIAILEVNESPVFWQAGEDEAIELIRLFGEHKSYLDIGCGVGRISIPLSKLTSNKVYAYDISDKMTEKGKTYYESDNLIWTNSLDNIKNVDVAFERLVFQHIPAPYLRELLPNVKNTLAIDGILYAHVGTCVFDKNAHHWSQLNDTDTWATRVYQEQELLDMFYKSGFKYDPYKVRSDVFPVHRLWTQI